MHEQEYSLRPPKQSLKSWFFWSHELRNLDWPMKSNRKTYSAEKHPAFVGRTERAFVRVARKVPEVYNEA
jgi:hypothetical protein